MDEGTARRVIDWLHATGCRVVGLMGGEPLIRAAFVEQFVRHAVGKGCYVYLPTNGRLLTPDVTDRLGDAGVATFNVAIDCIREIPGLPKALEHIRENFDYLVRLQGRYGYTVFLSINITRFNLEDVRLLTEFSRQNGVATAYHLCESSHGHTPFQSEELGPVDELLDYLIDRSRAGYAMVNSAGHLRAMKSLVRGGVAPWPCRAGQNMVVCRTDGTLAPCYPMREAAHDWGTAGCPKFDACQLAGVKQRCSESCFSTVAYMLANYYDIRRVTREVSAQAVRRLRGR
jgi:MoaA/NifB/PqqE/SkfB family radical SAM enzyme